MDIDSTRRWLRHTTRRTKFIFQEYKRGQRYKGDKQRKGFGLGLCYVAAVVKAHHGHIQVNSDGKQGTEFIIEIPQRKAKD